MSQSNMRNGLRAILGTVLVAGVLWDFSLLHQHARKGCR